MKNQLYYTKPAKCFEQALPLGNGRLGIMTYGNLRHERLSLNEDSLWSGYPKDQNKADAHKYLAACREAIFAKDYAKAKDILNRDMHGHWSEAYLPLGNLRIDYDRAYKKNYSRTLDLRTGVAVTRADGLTQTVFVSHPAQLVVVHIAIGPLAPHADWTACCKALLPRRTAPCCSPAKRRRCACPPTIIRERRWCKAAGECAFAPGCGQTAK